MVHTSGGAGGRDCSNHEWNIDVLETAVSKLWDYLTDWSKYKTPVEATFGDRGPREYILLRFETNAFSSDPSSGVYTSDDFSIYNSYANTNQLSDMIRDQMCKMQEYVAGI